MNGCRSKFQKITGKTHPTSNAGDEAEHIALQVYLLYLNRPEERTTNSSSSLLSSIADNDQRTVLK